MSRNGLHCTEADRTGKEPALRQPQAAGRKQASAQKQAILPRNGLHCQRMNRVARKQAAPLGNESGYKKQASAPGNSAAHSMQNIQQRHRNGRTCSCTGRAGYHSGIFFQMLRCARISAWPACAKMQRMSARLCPRCLRLQTLRVSFSWTGEHSFELSQSTVPVQAPFRQLNPQGKIPDNRR